MKKIILASLLTFTAFIAFSQSDYQKALGIKFPGGVSITYKNFVTENNNIELQGTFKDGGFRLSGLYEFNFYTLNVEGLSWFVGPGAHLGFGKKDTYDANNKLVSKSSADIGIDGIIGLDYKIKDLPLNISLDWQPSIVIAGNTDFSGAYGGIGIRYTF